MKNMKRILALLGVVLLLALYASTLFFALSDDPRAADLLSVSIYCTIVVPVLLYAYTFIYRLTHKSVSPASVEKPVIDTIIFDVGKVLVDYEWNSLLYHMGYDEAAMDAISKAVFLSEDWTEGDRGVRTEEEILASFIKNAPTYEKEIREVFANIGKTIHPYDYTERWISALKDKGYKLYILSNFSEPLYKQAKDKMPFLDKMDGGYMSYQVKCLKPEPIIYQKLIHDFSINPATSVFLDDRLENVAEARKQGLYAIHFTSKRDALQQFRELTR